MVRIEVTPTLTHCIETTARKEFYKSVDDYMQRDQEDEELEEKIELLRLFLESMDFKKLRRESDKYMTEGKTVRFILYLEAGEAKYELNVDP